ncbi:MAG: hypothetical protein HKN43_06880 [Rhodothermales bacterium]|nr:hypothetical protein [Rhodothermales bacterium]
MSGSRSSEAGILSYHEDLSGTLRCRRIKSEALGIYKPHYAYEPPGYESDDTVPIVYLFRGHEREWVNIDEDNSRGHSTAIQDIDLLIKRKVLPPMVLLMPGVSSTNNAVHSLGIDMMGVGVGGRGIGTGQFYTYLTEEFIPTMEQRYRVRPYQGRIAIGFSLGGYICSLLATRFSGYFDHVGIYDGTLPFGGYQDPRQVGDAKYTDRVWCRSPLLDTALGKPRKFAKMSAWNSVDIIRRADFHQLFQIRKTMFWVGSAAYGGYVGNRDRSRYFLDVLSEHDIPAGTRDVVFANDASHTWHWTDRFAVSLLYRLFVEEALPVKGKLSFVAKHLFQQPGTTGDSTKLG